MLRANNSENSVLSGHVKGGMILHGSTNRALRGRKGSISDRNNIGRKLVDMEDKRKGGK
jgi:hypothetical protein